MKYNLQRLNISPKVVNGNGKIPVGLILTFIVAPLDNK